MLELLYGKVTFEQYTTLQYTINETGMEEYTTLKYVSGQKVVFVFDNDEQKDIFWEWIVNTLLKCGSVQDETHKELIYVHRLKVVIL